MPVTNRQGPIYFFPKANKKYDEGYERIFGKKSEPVKPAPKQAKPKAKTVKKTTK